MPRMTTVQDHVLDARKVIDRAQEVENRNRPVGVMTSGEQAPSRPRGKRASLRRTKSHQPACSDSSHANASSRSPIIDPGHFDSMGRIEFSCLTLIKLRHLCGPAIAHGGYPR